jgi:hypothetical protein
MNIQEEETEAADTAEVWEQTARERVRRLRFGVIHLVVHEGRVTQVETTEKVRVSSETHTR